MQVWLAFFLHVAQIDYVFELYEDSEMQSDGSDGYEIELALQDPVSPIRTYRRFIEILTTSFKKMK